MQRNYWQSRIGRVIHRPVCAIKMSYPTIEHQTSASHRVVAIIAHQSSMAIRVRVIHCPGRAIKMCQPHYVPNQCEPSGSVAIAFTYWWQPRVGVSYTVQVVPSKCATPSICAKPVRAIRVCGNCSHIIIWQPRVGSVIHRPGRAIKMCHPPPTQCQTSVSHPGLWRLHARHHLAAQSWKCYTPSRSCHQNVPPRRIVPNQCEPSGSVAIASHHHWQPRVGGVIHCPGRAIKMRHTHIHAKPM